MSRPTQPKRGYTFVEILVVIAIVGILVALLLPAVQAAREAARRMNCGKNLEQLIIAVHNYEMLHQVYPPGTIDPTGPIQSLPQGYHHNWIIQLLPFIEQKNSYAHIDQQVGVYHPNNMPVRRIDISTLNCPSAPRAHRAYSDYAGVHNDVEAPIDVTNNGVFFLNSRISYFDLKDGSSNTIFIGEKDTFTGDLGWMSGTRATLRNAGVIINVAQRMNWARRRNLQRPTWYPLGLESEPLRTDTPLTDEETLDMLFGEEGERSSNLSAWREVEKSFPMYEQDGSLPFYEEYEGGMSMGSMAGAAGGMDDSDSIAEEQAAKKLAMSTFTDNPALAVGGFGSLHPGGAQFAKGDGSVQFYSESVDPLLLLQLANRDDGRLHDESW